MFIVVVRYNIMYNLEEEEDERYVLIEGGGVGFFILFCSN